jgi:hypothetical protein
MHYTGNIKEFKRLSKDDVIRLAPSVITEEPYHDLSVKYSNISTMTILESLMQENWYAIQAEEMRCNKKDREGYQKHMIRLQNDYLITIQDSGLPSFLNTILINSHDGRSAYIFHAGIYRQVCSNGLIVGNSFQDIHLKHQGIDDMMVKKASQELLELLPGVSTKVTQMQNIFLNYSERALFADSAKMLIAPEATTSIAPIELLSARHKEDMGQTNLWNVFNDVQENIIKGGIKVTRMTVKGERSKKSREVKAIDRKVNLNKALWTLAEKMQELKLLQN